MSLSAHMVDSFERKPSYAPYTSSRPPRPTMPQTPFTPFGADQSFAGDSWIEGHGYPPPRPSGSVGEFSRWSEEKVAALQVRLAKKLGPEFVTQRPGPGGGPKLSYVEGWKVINLANEVFGFNGWSSSIVSLTTDFLDVNDQGRVSVNVTAIVRITLADGCWHEDVGCGQGENIKSKGGALDKAKKEAVTDATKRALKTFGNVLGNCLYDKEYTKEIVKIKVPPTKFGTHDLERRPEFAEPSAPGPSRQPASAVPSHMSNAPKPVIPTHQTPQQPARNETVNPRPGTPIRDINDLSDGDFFMDENYDAEFAGLDEQSFINQSTSKQNISPTKPQQQQQPPAAGPSRMGPPGVSEYHHRHRPDPPPTTNARPAPSTGGAAARQAALLAASAAEPAKLQDPPTKPNMSSGSSDTLFDTPAAQRRPPQGAPPPDESSRPVASAPTAQSARALAIAAALADSARADSPRADSPRIPDGGINAVVAKTSNRIAASAVTLGLEKEVSVGAEDENTSGLAFGGFTSARGMKRSTSSGDRGAPQSPTKMPGRSEWIPPHLAGQQRRPLGELGVVPEGRGHGDNWEAKRPRGF